MFPCILLASSLHDLNRQEEKRSIWWRDDDWRKKTRQAIAYILYSFDDTRHYIGMHSSERSVHMLASVTAMQCMLGVVAGSTASLSVPNNLLLLTRCTAALQARQHGNSMAAKSVLLLLTRCTACQCGLRSSSTAWEQHGNSTAASLSGPK